MFPIAEYYLASEAAYHRERVTAGFTPSKPRRRRTGGQPRRSPHLGWRRLFARHRVA